MKKRNLLAILSVFLLTCVALLFAGRLILKRAGVNFIGGQAKVVDLTLPPGFQATIFAEGLDGPRFMAYNAGGVLFVAERGAGRIIALPDENGDGIADTLIEVVAGLNAPSSLVFQPETGAMYVGETNQVRRFILDDDYRIVAETTVVPDISTDGSHSTRTVVFGSDGKLYLSAGSTCNVCEEEDPRRAAITVFEADGSGERLYAKGLRNAVGMAVNPATGSLFATVNGRDLMGDDLPPETIYLVEEGVDYGWPRCHAGRIEDPDFGYPGACEGVGRPAVEFQAHSAPLGVAFSTGETFPPEYQGGMFVAYHGSWNRSVPTGYKVAYFPVNGDVVGEPQDFASGWLQPDDVASGRPVGVAVAPDGSLMVSDDKAGLIYRINYK